MAKSDWKSEPIQPECAIERPIATIRVPVLSFELYGQRHELFLFEYDFNVLDRGHQQTREASHG